MDLHVHTNFSDGEDAVAEVIQRARERGIGLLAITDHFDPYDRGVLNREATAEDLFRHFDLIRQEACRQNLKVLCGIETCTGMDGRLRLPQGVIDACDIIITSPHYLDYEGELKKGEWMNGEYWEAYKRLVIKMAAGEGDVLGHPESYLPFRPMLPDGTTFEDRMSIARQIADTYFDADYISHLSGVLLASGKAYELHGMSNSPREWVIEALHQMGVCFSIGSDAHALRDIGCNARALELAGRLGLRIITPKTKTA